MWGQVFFADRASGVLPEALVDRAPTASRGRGASPICEHGNGGQSARHPDGNSLEVYANRTQSWLLVSDVSTATNHELIVAASSTRSSGRDLSDVRVQDELLAS